MLIDLLAACFLLAIIGLICVEIIVPCIVAAKKYLADDGDRTQQALVRIRQEAASTTSGGLSFASQGSDWWLAIVPLDPPGTSGQRLWQTQMILYRYLSTSKSITRKVFDKLQWPDGSARLTGAEPAPFSQAELAGLDSTDSQTVASNLVGDPWPNLRSTWKLEFLAEGKSRTYFLNLGEL